MYSNAPTKGTISSFLTSKFSCKQPSHHIGLGSSPSTRKFHEEHNETHHELLGIFLSDGFAFTESFESPKMASPLRKFRVQCETSSWKPNLCFISFNTSSHALYLEVCRWNRSKKVFQGLLLLRITQESLVHHKVLLFENKSQSSTRCIHPAHNPRSLQILFAASTYDHIILQKRCVDV
jgi:hypothetical protein